MTKPGFTKFAWQPSHDDWLFVISGSTPMLLPSITVKSRKASVYHRVRDGFDGTASLLELPNGFAGTATLPTGTIVYATTGLGAGEGRVDVHNLAMPGILTGRRTYRSADGTVTVDAKPPGVARVDSLRFPAVTARHVRMMGVRPHPAYGYSMYSFEVGERTLSATASSWDISREPAFAVDGDHTTRWAVARTEPSWFRLEGRAPTGFTVVVHDGSRVTLTGGPAMVVLVAANGRRLPIVLQAGARREITIPGARPYPLDDLALGCTTFPTSPLPPGMSNPSAAVDDDPRTHWTPGPAGRMVVDLGAARPIGDISLKWTYNVRVY